MTIGTILLSQDDKYVNADGTLPFRPAFDKQFLTDLLFSTSVSREGYHMLPPSIQKNCYRSSSPDVAITIRELGRAHLLIVIRSPVAAARGKVFRLDDFTCILKDSKLELWKHKFIKD